MNVLFWVGYLWVASCAVFCATFNNDPLSALGCLGIMLLQRMYWATGEA